MIISASAENITISFSDFQLGRNIDIEVYLPTANGSKLVGQMNITGILHLGMNYDYVFIILHAGTY